MKKHIIDAEVKIFYVTAKSFPQGIQEAFDTLDKLVGNPAERTFYGISYADKAAIIYKAGVAEQYEGEAEKLGCELFTLKKGTYLTETIMDWRNNMPAFSATFQQLLATPLLDRTYPCVEWYKSDEEVMCMVKIIE